MKRTALLAYQWLTGISDTATGVLLCVAPLTTLHVMGISAPPDAAPYIAYVGAFVLSVGAACMYGVRLIATGSRSERIEMIWLLTAFSRSAVAIYVLTAILAGSLELAWLPVAIFDAACAIIQSVGLRRKWIENAL